jgi:hypothetical protein
MAPGRIGRSLVAAVDNHAPCNQTLTVTSYSTTTGAWPLERSAYVGARSASPFTATAASPGEASWQSILHPLCESNDRP